MADVRVKGVRSNSRRVECAERHVDVCDLFALETFTDLPGSLIGDVDLRLRVRPGKCARNATE